LRGGIHLTVFTVGKGVAPQSQFGGKWRTKRRKGSLREEQRPGKGEEAQKWKKLVKIEKGVLKGENLTKVGVKKRGGKEYLTSGGKGGKKKHDNGGSGEAALRHEGREKRGGKKVGEGGREEEPKSKA